MAPPDRSGLSLAEILVALLLLMALALVTAPLAARIGMLTGRGRAVLEGGELAARRVALHQAATGAACLGAGQDRGVRAQLDWVATARDSMTVSLVAVLRDSAGRWPAETLATLVTCPP